jgi:VanZ family protein
VNKKRLILWIVVVLTTAFIFGQSLYDQETSKKQSVAVQEKVVEPVHKALTGEDTIHYDIRDVAHTVEFAILGLELLLLVRSNKRILQWLKSISYCGLAALIDETIQHFSGRAPQLIDIWHDILGAIVGSVIGVILLFVVEQVRLKGKV